MEKMALKEINVTSSYLRTETDVESLKQSINAVGLINPLTVNQDNELLAGGRRYQALTELGFTEAPVVRVDMDTLEQELISIDENLIRTPLSKLEFEQCLNRGRDIYEQLNPSAPKVDLEDRPMTTEDKKAAKEEEMNDTTSFAAVTAQKTGLSKSVIKNAIKRDAKSSEEVKRARGAGELSATQVNEIIKLDKEEQEMILPYVKEKAVKDVKKIVDAVKKDGVDTAIRRSQEIKAPPRELKQLGQLSKRCSKVISKIMVEDMSIEGDYLSLVMEQMADLHQQTKDFLERYDFEQGYATNHSGGLDSLQENLSH